MSQQHQHQPPISRLPSDNMYYIRRSDMCMYLVRTAPDAHNGVVWTCQLTKAQLFHTRGEAEAISTLLYRNKTEVEKIPVSC